MERIPNSLVVVGEGTLVAEIALRRIVKLKECPGPVLMLDYTGRGAIILHGGSGISLPEKKTIWFDIADRRRPVALLQLQDSPHFTESPFSYVKYDS